MTPRPYAEAAPRDTLAPRRAGQEEATMSSVTTHSIRPSAYAYPNRHFGAGCPLTHGDGLCRDGFIYVARVEPGLYKIGCTAVGVVERVAWLRKRMYPEIALLMWASVNCALGAEAYLHDRFFDGHVGREVFRLAPDALPLIQGVREFGGQMVHWEVR